MLENGKMGLLRRFFEAILGHNVINRHFFRGIRRHFFSLIRGLRPANLDCRITSGNDNKVECVTSGNDSRAEEWFVKRSTGRSPWMTIKKSILSQDTRNKSGNDGCQWRLFSGCKLFNYPSPADKSATSPARGEVTRLLCCARNDICCLGRSMIEMLGVLAIIGVLSVGGIAGYSKAMDMYKLNRLVDQYAYLFRGLVEYRKSLVVTGGQTSIKDAVLALDLIPSSWDTNYYSFAEVKDEIGNRLNLLSRYNELVFDLTLDASPDFSTQLCENLMQRLFQPMHSVINRIVFFDLNGVNSNLFYFGDTMCEAAPNYCLRDMDVVTIHQACSYCAIKEDSNCFLVIYF